tara:strand:- start:3338 stop:3532 length:195 start_codon:yes stop_codon:yes gene_type:complete
MQYFTVKEAAHILRMHPREVWKAISEHRLGAFRRGERGAYLITQKHIDRFLVPAGADWKPKKAK